MILCRRRIWFVVLVGLVLSGGLWMWWASAQALWVADAHKIKTRMTIEEVETVFGRPLDWRPEFEEKDRGWSAMDVWVALDGIICVYSDNDRVTRYSVKKENVFVRQFNHFRWKYTDWCSG